MAIDQSSDVLPTTANAGFTADWDYKGAYVDSLTSDGLERYAQYSATPDTTMLFAGPARFSGLNGDASTLVPIGLTDGLSFSANPQLARLYEIGSNRAFFTRGKTQSSLTLGKMLADQANILAALTANNYSPPLDNGGESEAGTGEIAMNLDSETFGVPFGLLIVFKTRGGGDGFGVPLTAVYCEYCMFSNYQFQVANQSPVIVENVGIEFDRPVPVSFS